MRVNKEENDAIKRVHGLKEVVQPCGISPAKKKAKVAKIKPAAPSQSINRNRLLNRVVSFYHQSFCEDGGALQYLQSMGIADNSIFVDFQVGYSNGTILNTIPEDGDITEGLKEIGILTDRGKELFYGSVVFPVFDENKDCVGLYGRRIESGEVVNLYLPGPRRSVWNWQAAKRSKSIILTGSIIDAVTLYNVGFKDVIPCCSVNGLIEDHLELFARYQTKEVYICFDRDDAEEQGAAQLARQLKERSMDAYIITPPQIDAANKTDINTFFLTADAPSIFERLLREANPRTSIRSDKIISDEQRHYEKTDTGLIVQYEARRYEVRGISKEGIKLKATIKAIKQNSGKARFHLDTVDLYSNRSRLLFAKACTSLFSEKEELIREDAARLIDLCESWQPQEQAKTLDHRMTRTEEEEALEFLKDPLLLTASFRTLRQ